MNIKVEKGVPFPVKTAPYDELVEAMKTMEMGDSFLYRAKYTEKIRKAAQRAKINITIKVVDPNADGLAKANAERAAKAAELGMSEKFISKKAVLRQYRVWRIK